ncbi:homeobox ARX homolog alr-1-like [Oscarella lobularis]|uniref:homeobox ARX homolog alr-1-like n=1 Tax=Oscarella lobularis TaxID=121494 RepID=UPI0033138D3C
MSTHSDAASDSDCYAAGNLFYDIPDVDSTLDGDEIAGLTRQRRTRVMFTRFQLKQLERLYAVDQYPKLETRRRVGDQMGITERRIQVWFQNRRAKAKRDGTLTTPPQYAKFNGHAMRYGRRNSDWAAIASAAAAAVAVEQVQLPRDVSSTSILQSPQLPSQPSETSALERPIQDLRHFVGAQCLHLRQMGAKLQADIRNL